MWVFSVYRLDGDMLIPVRDVPIFDRRKIGYEKFYYKSKDQEYIRTFQTGNGDCCSQS